MCKIETFNMSIPYTGLQRRIWVCLPSGYTTKETRYPVLYMHDGQNLFDESTSYKGVIWDVHTALEMAMTKKVTDGVIIVGIDNASSDNDEKVGRLDEYSPWVNTFLKDMQVSNHLSRDVGGYGDAYAKFIIEKLKPHIDSVYRTLPDRDNTGVAGSSMGGLISLYMGLKYPEVFSKVAAFSTAVWFAEKELIELVLSHDHSLIGHWYIDIGTNETSNEEVPNFNEIYVNGTMAVYESFLKTGLHEDRLKLVVDEGAAHNEEAWSRRFPLAFRWLFGKN